MFSAPKSTEANKYIRTQKKIFTGVNKQLLKIKTFVFTLIEAKSELILTQESNKSPGLKENTSRCIVCDGKRKIQWEKALI